jgi:DNA-binding transcriptional MerR regulator
MRRDEWVVEEAPALTAAAAAGQLGVAVSTLRSWSRRYGLDPSDHRPGRHRRYDGADMARLELMRTLVARGVAPADAAAWVQREPMSSPTPAVRGRPTHGPGRFLPGLVKAAHRLDALALVNGISRQLAARGVVSAWNEVCLPLITDVVNEEADCTDVEHLLSWTITVALHRIPDVPRRPGAPIALLACVEDEWHTLGLDALRAALAERDAAARMLGAATPTTALATAAQRIGPAAVVLWSQSARTARNRVLTSAGVALPADTVIIAAGPGWSDRGLPSGVLAAHTLTEAVLMIADAFTGLTEPDLGSIARPGVRSSPPLSSGPG